MKKVTLEYLAERTGYSITTISRTLNGKAGKYRISKKACDIIKHEARQCGYMRPLPAQNLSNKKSGLIGLLLPSVANPYFAEMASVIISELHEKGYTTIVVDMMENEDNLIPSTKSLLTHQVEGIIISPCGDTPVQLEKLSEQLPIVLIDRYFENTGLSYVTTDNYRGGVDGTRELIRNGHKKIACIQGALKSTSNKERVRGYKDTMEASGLADNITVVGKEFSVKNGYLEAKLLMVREDRPTAIFALSNTILLGVLKAVREARLRVPEDISIVSFDDNMYMDYLTPIITRVSQPVEDMATLATMILLDNINNEKPLNSQIKLTPSMVNGASVIMPDERGI